MASFAAGPAVVTLVLSALVVCSMPALAGDAVAGQGAPVAVSATNLLSSDLRWEELTLAQRSALAPLKAQWAGIDPVRRQKWVEIADRFPSMTADERARVQTRMGQWARMSPKERGEARVHFQELRPLGPSERQARWERYQALTAEQKAELARRSTPELASRPGTVPAGAAGGPAPTPKSNIVSARPVQSAATRSVAPTVVQGAPGATTKLITQQPQPPMHQQPGMPKVTATPDFVDTTTLLPRRGAQAAGVRAAASAPPAASTR